MKEQTRQHLRQIINSVILAGIIMFFIGLYYWIIKAGIPYQNPPLELQIQYTVNMTIGEILLKNGFVIAISGIIVRFLLKIIFALWTVTRNTAIYILAGDGIVVILKLW